jgi:hypothetical protein
LGVRERRRRSLGVHGVNSGFCETKKRKSGRNAEKPRGSFGRNLCPLGVLTSWYRGTCCGGPKSAVSALPTFRPESPLADTPPKRCAGRSMSGRPFGRLGRPEGRPGGVSRRILLEFPEGFSDFHLRGGGCHSLARDSSMWFPSSTPAIYDGTRRFATPGRS